jgi:chaperonin GroES
LKNGKVRALDVKAGNKVLFAKFSGQTVKVGVDELLVVRAVDVIAVLEG